MRFIFAAIAFQVVVIALQCRNGVFVASVHAKFTNFECRAFDERIAFRKCRLKMVQRNVVGLFMHMENHMPATQNVVFNVEFMRKASGYKPFLYNITFNGCAFLTNMNSVPIAKLIFNEFKSYTNLNHTCPYTHDIILERVIFHAYILNTLPIPCDDYLMIVRVAVDNNLTAIINTYMNVA